MKTALGDEMMKLVNVYGILSQMSMLKHEMNDYDWGWYPDELHEPIQAFYRELLKITGTLCEWLDPRLYTGK